ncbi:hypothetical protein P3X46_027251 [Hevea brasiliensis]|uniref:DM2 domain-containing protein n=1 Tax=Hevea brasiliensis TaxID=3981 RepID=A0ABQ9L0C0_HEVBR|nr:uncharacterized protein LOC110650471 [Hevea brasiliensis]KAJ9153854.1 hypothetical protein P3X46_027251 [Hevea brasiliensis]KAJ9153855.1 hypothetical protein P3X46_027251 [Hevea brasiliensis]KAJ9153856.1 hypothetical protein P3X46_027251 [Hevea brasiliensis]
MTEQEISQALESLLQDCSRSSSNPNSASTQLTSLNAVVQHLQSKLGLDLSHKADFIRAQIQQFLFQPPLPPPQSQHPHPPPPPHRNDHAALQQNPNFYPVPAPTVSSAFHSSSTQPLASVKPETLSVSSTEVSKQSGPNKAKRRGGPGGLNKLCGVSPQLETIVGQPALPRTEIVKQLWAYIRKNNLQDPSNKRKIICNDELRLVFETDCTDMFKMNKLLAKHIIPLEPTKQLGSKKQKMDEETAEKQTISAPSVAISEGLANFFGVGVKEMLQSEVFTRLWEYINVNNLEDPRNPMVILCDAKLQELFGCQSLPASRIPEVLARHHIFRT